MLDYIICYLIGNYRLSYRLVKNHIVLSQSSHVTTNPALLIM